jgi:hypothetical protein
MHAREPAVMDEPTNTRSSCCRRGEQRVQTRQRPPNPVPAAAQRNQRNANCRTVVVARRKSTEPKRSKAGRRSGQGAMVLSA